MFCERQILRGGEDDDNDDVSDVTFFETELVVTICDFVNSCNAVAI